MSEGLKKKKETAFSSSSTSSTKNVWGVIQKRTKARELRSKTVQDGW